MSDLGDRAGESVGEVEAHGGVFLVGPRPRQAGKTFTATSATRLPSCECGGRPAYKPHPALRSGGPQVETLACGSCGNSVGPYAARHQLAAAWRLGGWKRETG